MATASFGTGVRTVGGEITINTATHRNQFGAKVTKLADGNLIVVWADDDRSETGALGDNSGYAVKGQLIAPDGSLIGSEFLINTSITGHQVPREVFALPHGGFTVVWTVAPNTAAPDVVAPVARAFSASGVPVTGEVFIDSTTSARNAPQFSQLLNGNIVVSYGDVRTRIFDQDLDQVGPTIAPTQFNANQSTRDVVVLDDGGVVVIWGDQTLTPTYQFFDASGTPVGPAIRTLQITSSSPVYASVALDNGNVLMFYPVGTTSRSVSAMILSPTGVISNVSVAGGSLNMTASVIALADGKFLATFTNATTGNARIFNADGSFDGPAFNVEGVQAWALPNGGFITTWIENGNLYGQAYTSSGQPIGEQSLIDVGANGEVEIEVMPDGSLFVIWTDTDLGAANTEIRGQRLGPVVPQAIEQTAVSLKTFEMAVTDTSSGVITVTLSASYGILIVTGGGSGATVSGSGTGTVTITGTQAQINALLRTDATSTVNYIADTDAPPATATLTMTVSGAGTATATSLVYINGVDDPGLAAADAAASDEATAIRIYALANDDPDGGSVVTHIAGVAAVVGAWIDLPSGARARFNADGSITWDPNGAFDGLSDGADGTDSFTYTITGGSSAVATVTISGLSSTSNDDTFDLGGGGGVAVNGGRGNDGFNFWDTLTAGDTVNGGDGDADQVTISGDYTGGRALTLTGAMLTNVERLVLLNGVDARYAITVSDDLLGPQETLTVTGIDLDATAEFSFDGSAETDGAFTLFGGFGADTFVGGGGDDHFVFAAGRFDAATDRVNGGSGSGDQVTFIGSQSLTLSSTLFTSIEVIALRSEGPSAFVLTLTDDLVAPGGSLTIYGLPVVGSILVDGQAENTASLRIYGGLGDDTLFGGAANDWIYGGLGGDSLYGSAGADIFAYTAVAESTSATYDRILWFNPDSDFIDLPQTVTGIAGTVSGGTLSTASFDADMAAAIGAGQMGAGQALLYNPNAGTLAGLTFLIVDANGIAGYQAGEDYIFELLHPPGALIPNPFF